MGIELSNQKSFISDARRNQIINAAITTLDEIGYVNASLAQIAKRAAISTALISYHFNDKNDLMNHTLMTVLANTTSYVLERVKFEKQYREKLHIFILASLEYQSQHRNHYNALLEIVFNARTHEGVHYYKLNDNEEDPILLELQAILSEGQKAGEFRAFNVYVMANAIQGAIGEYMGNLNLSAKIDPLTYGAELVSLFDRVVLSG